MGSRLYWKHCVAGRVINFNSIPFAIGEKRDLHFQFGIHYFGQKTPSTATKPATQPATQQSEKPPSEYSDQGEQNQPNTEEDTSKPCTSTKKPRLKVSLQGTRKIGCHAGIHIRQYILYPDYKVTSGTLSKWQERKAQEQMLHNLRRNLLGRKTIKTVTKYFVSLPSEEAHHKSHKTGGMHATAQRVHPKMIAKIQELVGAGISEVSEVKRALKLYATKELCTTDLPHKDDRAYYPTNHDLMNHIYKAKSLFQLSKLDQENLALKMKEWDRNTPDSKMYFRPFRKKSPKEQFKTDSTKEHTCISEYEQTLLWIHQEPWQQDQLVKYGNIITLMDATYKTTHYELPLYFLTVRTNVGYSVVAEFVIQHERTEDMWRL